MTQTSNQSLDIKNFLEETYANQLTDDEFWEHKNKLVQFFSLLMEIDKKQKQKSAKEVKQDNE
jgi:hypothetical protein